MVEERRKSDDIINKLALSVATLTQKVNNLDEKLADIKADIKELKDNLVGRVTNLEQTRPTKEEVEKAIAADRQEHELFATNEAIETVKKDVEGIRDNIKWGVRIVVGAVIAAIMGIIFIK